MLKLQWRRLHSKSQMFSQSPFEWDETIGASRQFSWRSDCHHFRRTRRENEILEIEKLFEPFGKMGGLKMLPTINQWSVRIEVERTASNILVIDWEDDRCTATGSADNSSSTLNYSRHRLFISTLLGSMGSPLILLIVPLCCLLLRDTPIHTFGRDP